MGEKRGVDAIYTIPYTDLFLLLLDNTRIVIPPYDLTKETTDENDRPHP
jgi:hypothetical protein